MDGAWHILALIGLDLVLLIGWIAIPLGLAGNFILLGAALVTAIVTRFETVGWIALIVMAVAVVAGEIIEALLGSLVARRFGASKWGMIGAFVGGILGAVLGTAILPIIGTLFFSFLGVAVGAMALELAHRKEAGPGMRAGWGALLGRFTASAIKMAIGMAMIIYIVIRTH
jgi:uncharacterized protein YqgC (DUF456 family)